VVSIFVDGLPRNLLWLCLDQQGGMTSEFGTIALSATVSAMIMPVADGMEAAPARKRGFKVLLVWTARQHCGLHTPETSAF
jgi:hypothetical protein